MKDDQITTVTLNILDKPYQVKATKSHVRDLQQAALFLDEKMREIKEIGSLKSLDHIFLMAALNISNELIHGNSSHTANGANIEQRVQKMQQKLNDTFTANSNQI